MSRRWIDRQPPRVDTRMHRRAFVMGAVTSVALPGCGASKPAGPSDPRTSSPAPEPAPTPASTPPASEPLAAADPEAISAAPDPDAPPSGVRGEVVLVPLGEFPVELLDAIERALKEELQVAVRRMEEQPLPQDAWYPKRKRYRADVLLDHLAALIADEPSTTRALGLTSVDISTSKPPHEDWGIFGLGQMPGPSCVVSRFRLKRKAKNAAQIEFRVVNTAIHEVGHTFGLDHCTESRCPMLDAEGSIANTDSSSGHLGEGCRALLERAFPITP